MAVRFRFRVEKCFSLGFLLWLICLAKTVPGHSQTSNSWYNDGLTKYQNNNCKGAILDFSKAIELDPTNAYAFSSRANCRGLLGDYMGAIADWNRAIEILPIAMMFAGRATAKAELKDYRGAILDFNKAIELDGSVHVNYYLRGIAKLFAGQKESACLDFSKAGELGLAEAYDRIRENCQ